VCGEWRLGDVGYESTSDGRTAVTSRSRAGDVSWYVWWTHRCHVEGSFGHPSVAGLLAVGISYAVGF